MSSNENYIIEECRYCGNKTKLDIVGKYVEYGEPEDLMYKQNWLMLKCCVCNKISLASLYSGEDTIIRYTDGDEYDYEKIYTTHFPVETYKGTNVPENVDDAFSSALKVRYVDNIICLMALRRTLEIICKDMGARGKTLEKKILDLTEKSIFPKIINEASDVLRILGNEAAHGDDVDYDERIIQEMINFTQIIIEYVYVIPHRISVIKAKLTNSK